jgi:hypothetical protein
MPATLLDCVSLAGMFGPYSRRCRKSPRDDGGITAGRSSTGKLGASAIIRSLRIVRAGDFEERARRAAVIDYRPPSRGGRSWSDKIGESDAQQDALQTNLRRVQPALRDRPPGCPLLLVGVPAGASSEPAWPLRRPPADLDDKDAALAADLDLAPTCLDRRIEGPQEVLPQRANARSPAVRLIGIGTGILIGAAAPVRDRGAAAVDVIVEILFADLGIGAVAENLPQRLVQASDELAIALAHRNAFAASEPLGIVELRTDELEIAPEIGFEEPLMASPRARSSRPSAKSM